MIAVLPGLGANGSMYAGPWRQRGDYVFVDWPRDLGAATLNDLTDWVADNYSGASALVGSSLGGMIALLASSKMGLPKVGLLGSALSYAEVRPFFKMLQPLSSGAPFQLLQSIAGFLPLELAKMYALQDPTLMKSLLLDLPNFAWDNSGMEVVRIHGLEDRVIKCPKKLHLGLPAGHLIAMSHPEQCCAALLQNGL